MKEVFKPGFWRDVKRTFDEAREGRAPNPPDSHSDTSVDVLARSAGTAQPGCAGLSAILLDMDGVLYDAGRPIAGAADAVRWVQSEGIPHLFVTNTTSRSRGDLVRKLAAFGIVAAESGILTPITAAAEWLRAEAKGSIAAFLRPSALAELAGLPLLSEDAERGAAYIVIGDLGELWDYRTLNRAFRLLHSNPDAKLIALGMTRYWMAADGVALDVAPFVVALEHASGRKPLAFGKPGDAFFRSAAERLGVSPGRILMISDDIDADVGGAQAAGLKAALVKTGKFRAADLECAIRPEIVLDSVADLPRRWNSERPDLRSDHS